jgi:hypothetical protein
MSTKPPSGTGLAAVGPDDDDATSIADGSIDVIIESKDKPHPGSLTLPAPGTPSGAKTPAPLSAKTPGPILKTPAPISKTPGPTPAPVAKRDASSMLPNIPAARKEPSGAFPLPGMAPPEASKSSDDDKTLIARLSVLDDLAEESTKVEEIDEVLRAASTKKGGLEEPIALADQATAEREKARAVSAADRVAAAEFEDPGDDDDEVIMATPGIISISDDDDDEEPTASQRPPGARKTPTPTTAGARLQTPVPLAASGPRLPAPTPPPGRSLRLPTPSGGLPPIPMPLVSPASAPQRAITPALPIPAPSGAPAAATSTFAFILNKVQLPIAALVAFLVAVFGLGFLVGDMWRGSDAVTTAPAAPAPAAAVAPTPAPAPAAAPTPAPAPAAPVGEPAAAAPTEAKAAPEEPKVEAKPVEPEPAPEAPAPVRHVPVAHPKPIVHKAPVATAPVAAKPAAAKPAAAAAKPAAAAAKPAAAAAPKPAAAKPAAAKAGGKAKNWVDPFAE